MSDVVREAVAALRAALDVLTSVPLCSESQDEVLELAREFEVQRRRMSVLDHRLVGELDARSSAETLGVRDTATVLRGLLRLAPGEAVRRVRAAHALGARETATGLGLAPRFPAVAAAQAAGEVSAEHALVITACIEELPAAVRAGHGEQVEADLLARAADFDPTVLAKLGRHVHAVLDPDGTLATVEDQQRTRSATLTQRRDGTGELHAHLTADTLATVQAVLSPLAAPRPRPDGQDGRSAPQRLHDALDAAAGMLLRSGALPACGGTPATVLLTMALEQLENRTGLVSTGHGGQLTIDQALHLAGEADVLPIVVDQHGGVLAYGRTRRVATARQRRVLGARDHGCVFPGCDHPPDWTEAHHITPWQDGGTTDIDNLALLCDFHHDHHERAGWQIVMTDGIPHAIPPTWIDPHRRPIRNTIHDTVYDPLPAA